MKPLQTLLMTTLAAVCLAASAQWQWVDNDGRKVFSDRPPPAEIPDKNVLKRPGARVLPTTSKATSAENPSDAASGAIAAKLPASAGKTSALDKELEAKKKQAAEAERAKVMAEEDRVARAKAENCNRAKQGKTTFDSGIRIARINAAGEREVMDEAARAEEVRRIQGVMERDCQ
ncbi:MAG: DUF4124 domain-containing protein [Rhodoferax sp.]|nr:DUF4124 domain-containing protein [Rhodoferax sp.]